MRRQAWIAALACAAALVSVAGCGDDDTSEVDEAISDLEKASGDNGGAETTKSSASPTPTDLTSDARGLIRAYFQLIDEGEFTQAWSYLDPEVQDEFGGYESWRDGYGATTSTEVTDVDVTFTDGEETDLTVRIEAVATCDGERYEQDFEGPFSVDAARKKITAAEFALVSGSSPPTGCS